MTIAVPLKADCSYALKACNSYVKALEKEKGLLKDKIDILSKQVKTQEREVSGPRSSITTVGIVGAGGVGLGGTAVAVGAPLLAVGVGIAALIIAFVGQK